MFNYLAEGPWLVYFIIVALIIVCAFVIIVTRKGTAIAVFGTAALVLVLLAMSILLLDYFVVTDREQVEITTYELVQAAEKGDIEGIRKGISPEFQIMGINRDALLKVAEERLPPAKDRKIDVWAMETVEQADGKEIKCSFSANASDYGVPLRVELTYMKDLDGTWRVRRVRATRLSDNREVFPRM